MDNKKRILIIKACGIKGEDEECDLVANFCRLSKIDVSVICPKSNEELYDYLKNNGEFNFMYLSSHGNESMFKKNDGSVSDTWDNLSAEICKYGCLGDDSIIMLSCCRSGLQAVAYTLFDRCSMISYVIGAKQSLSPSQMSIAFSIFLFNIIDKNNDPVVAAEKIRLSTDLRFIGFDRMETTETMEYKNFTKNYIQIGSVVVSRTNGKIMIINQFVENEDNCICSYEENGVITYKIFNYNDLTRIDLM